MRYHQEESLELLLLLESLLELIELSVLFILLFLLLFVIYIISSTTMRNPLGTIYIYEGIVLSEYFIGLLI